MNSSFLKYLSGEKTALVESVKDLRAKIHTRAVDLYEAYKKAAAESLYEKADLPTPPAVSAPKEVNATYEKPKTADVGKKPLPKKGVSAPKTVNATYEKPKTVDAGTAKIKGK